MEIREITNDMALSFLKANHAEKEVVFIRPSEIWYGAFIGSELVGIAGTNKKKNHTSLDGVFVNKANRNKGVATALMKHIIPTINGDIITYARPIMADILIRKFGFKDKQHFKNGTIKVERSE